MIKSVAKIFFGFFISSALLSTLFSLAFFINAYYTVLGQSYMLSSIVGKYNYLPTNVKDTFGSVDRSTGTYEGTFGAMGRSNYMLKKLNIVTTGANATTLTRHQIGQFAKASVHAEVEFKIFVMTTFVHWTIPIDISYSIPCTRYYPDLDI